MTARIRRETFDVFDTVLTRAIGSSDAVFLLLGHRLAQEGRVKRSPEHFARARLAAEERAHADLGARCTLEDIYREVASGLSLDPSVIPELVQAECEVEAVLLRPVPRMLDRIARARSESGYVVYISDTYFPSGYLQARLVEHGLWQAGDRCYASCEWGALKGTGELYEVVAREEGLQPGDLCHTGNDEQADVRHPRSRGWAAVPFAGANANRYERLLEASSYASGGLSTALAGASRLTRLSGPQGEMRQAAIRDVAAGVVAPVLTGYVLWLLQRAQRMGLRRLYFLARDGQVLLRIAERFVERLNLDLELRYLYASRQAWNPAATFEGSETELAWIWDTTDRLNAEMVLRRADVPAEAISRELEAAGLPRLAWRRQLTPRERDALGRVLASDTVMQRVLAAASAQRELLLRYFEQEGLLCNVPYGVVDLGWYGSMQKALAAVLSGAGRAAPPGFYFALHKGDIVDEEPLQREAYYLDERKRMGYIDAVPNLIALMEMFCTADHGTTLGFEERGGKVEPVLQEAVNSPATAWGLPVLHGSLEAFANHLFLDNDYLDPYADVRGAFTRVLTEFSRHPTAEEAAVWGDFPWEDGLGTDTVRNRFAMPYGARDLLKALKIGSIRPHHRASWIEGSLALSSAPLRVALRGAALFGRRRRTLRARLQRQLMPSEDHSRQ